MCESGPEGFESQHGAGSLLHELLVFYINSRPQIIPSNFLSFEW